jgi:hypothetical protein
VINVVPSLEKCRRRLFSNVRDVCAALSSQALPHLKKKFSTTLGSLVITYMNMCKYIIYEYVYVCMCLYVHAYMYVYTFIYIYTHLCIILCIVCQACRVYD